MCSLTAECVLLLQNVFSYYRMWNTHARCMMTQNVFSYYRMYSLLRFCPIQVSSSTENNLSNSEPYAPDPTLLLFKGFLFFFITCMATGAWAALADAFAEACAPMLENADARCELRNWSFWSSALAGIHKIA